MIVEFIEKLEKDKKTIESYRQSNAIEKTIYKQAARHYDRDASDDLFRIARPNEMPGVTNYRNENKRNITFEIPEKWFSKSTRIVRQSALAIDTIKMSDILYERLNKDEYDYKGQKISFEYWLFNIIVPQCGKDPNAVLIEVPYNKEEPNEVPFNDSCHVIV